LNSSEFSLLRRGAVSRGKFVTFCCLYLFEFAPVIVFEACKYRLIYATSLPRPTDKTFLTSRAVDLNVGGVPTSQENKHNIVLLINLDVFIAQVTRKISKTRSRETTTFLNWPSGSTRVCLLSVAGISSTSSPKNSKIRTSKSGKVGAKINRFVPLFGE
jgi:hypothetical protein